MNTDRARRLSVTTHFQGGKIGVLGGMFNLGASGASENKERAANRIQFAVPVLLPVSQAPPEARKRNKKE